jgi:hypothetical protein
VAFLAAVITVVAAAVGILLSDEQPTGRLEPERSSVLAQRLIDQIAQRARVLTGEEAAGWMKDCLTKDLPTPDFRPDPAAPVSEVVLALADHLEELRGLSFEYPVDPKLLSSGPFEARFRRLVLSGYTPRAADADGRLLAALGMVPPGTDMRRLAARSARHVSGFYDPATDDILVRADDAELNAVDWMVLVHEMEHALVDQHFGLAMSDTYRPGQGDERLATLALTEGDATLTMQLFLLSLTPELQRELPRGLIVDPFGDLAGVPEYIQREILFPYGKGLEFACYLYTTGGWSAINQAYRTPPATTSQILFPERYADGEDAETPPPPGTLHGPWRSVGTRSIGAVDLLFLFRAVEGPVYEGVSSPLAGASSWNGGVAHVWKDGPRSAVGVSLRERVLRSGLCLDMVHWYEGRFPESVPVQGPLEESLTTSAPQQAAVIRCEEGVVRLGIAPDIGTARALTRR